MGKVVNLDDQRPENKYCFVCACENQTFVLRPDAKIQCTYCEEIMPQLIWGQFFVSQNPEIAPTEHKK